ncbi:hypothetical protein BDP81DRAFT_403559 [Colletotrichum phormii]|uniref:Uncharacterized protein n=1 Tax=Colletotrichum phormii TaxID=359342 RepID=A0AAJ0A0A5_9PEZI|nr:uncharacterized protein BDP81DRAFT_403559 [Colletotrichum phormii]KAK1641525.1 hypothetical protein BDP81DRAFT_403559 [Colletotrichum phormii]
MAPVVSNEVVFTYDKKAKEKVRKCGASAKRKAVQLGKGAQVFSAVIHFNPTHGQLDGAVYVPDGQSIPDVNGFLAELVNGMHGGVRRRRVIRRQRKRTTSEPGQNTVETGDNVEMGEVGSSVQGEPDVVGVEDAKAKEALSGDVDAPHEIEADDDGAAVFGGTVSDVPQDHADVDEDPNNPAGYQLPADTALFKHDVEGLMGGFVMSDTDTASAMNAAGEDSFLGLPEIDLHDLFEMEACASTFRSVGKVEGGDIG